MRSSSPTPTTSRPLPHQLDSSTRAFSSTSPSSPSSPYSPLSAASTEPASAGYFSDTHPNSHDRNLLHRLAPSSFRTSSDHSRPRSKSPGGSRPKSFSASTTTDRYAHGGSSPDLGGGAVFPPTGRKECLREKRSSGTYTQCGRHSNDWLFGGLSVRDAVRGVFTEKK